MPKLTPQERALQIQWSKLRKATSTQRKGSLDFAPSKKSAKRQGRMQNTFASNLKGVPGGGIVGMIAAPKTGTRTRKESIGILASARNANTTQGSYNRTVVKEQDEVVSDRQGRKVFGR